MDHNKFSGLAIYQMEITGNIRKIWEVTDADEDLGFQRFLVTQRIRTKSWKGNGKKDRGTTKCRGMRGMRRRKKPEPSIDKPDYHEPRGDRGVGDGGFAVIPSRPQI